MKKFKLTNEKQMYFGRVLYRIKSLRNFANVSKGDLGGFVEKEGNLSHNGNAWISDNAWISGNASKTPIVVTGLKYTVTIGDAHMKIGCHFNEFEVWDSFTNEEIAELSGDVGNAILWNQFKPFLFSLIEFHTDYKTLETA